MKITNHSKKLISFFKKNKYIEHISPTKKAINILNYIYDDILEAYNYLIQSKKNNNMYYITTKEINASSQITKPQGFNFNTFPEKIRQHINENSMSEISYTFSLFNRNIKLFFITEDTNIELKIEEYNKRVEIIIIWLHILSQYSSNKCSKNIKIYFYFTSLNKELPHSNINILDEQNVNTAFTTSCLKDTEIVVYRKEEWLKVFIHETFHSFGLDFSDMNTDICTQQILKIFPINSKVNLFESYSEFWAEIINVSICSFIFLKNKNNVDEFIDYVTNLINIERSYSFFQLVKTLNFMGLNYSDLYDKNVKSQILRENLYRENTNVLSYYIIKTILLNNYSSFLLWCKTNNFSLLNFKKTNQNINNFCNFIDKNYKTSSMLKSVKNAEKILHQNKSKKEDNYILSNMRMTIFELG